MSMSARHNFIAQAAAIPYRIDAGGRLEVLLICRPHTDNWGIPKGKREPGATLQQTALREAFEEAGIEGEVSDEPVGRFLYEKNQRTHLVDVYDLKVTRIHDEYPEKDLRLRQWYDMPTAAALISRKAVARIVAELPGRVTTMG